MPQVSAGQRVTAALLSQDYTNADASTTTVTAGSGSPQDLSSVYTIPAGDAEAGTIYELTAWGNGTWGSTTHNLFLYAALAGNPIGAGSEIDSGLFNASQLFRWRYTARLICVSAGASGTWLQEGDGIVAVYNGPINPGVTAKNSAAFTDSLSAEITQDTTVSNSFCVQALWGGSSCSVTCHATMFSRRA